MLLVAGLALSFKYLIIKQEKISNFIRQRKIVIFMGMAFFRMTTNGCLRLRVKEEQAEALSVFTMFLLVIKKLLSLLVNR